MELEKNNKNYYWIYEKEVANFYFDEEKWTEAKFAFEEALISVQEINNENEADICKKLGIVHSKLNLFEEAIFYFNQFLMIVQQKKDILLLTGIQMKLKQFLIISMHQLLLL